LDDAIVSGDATRPQTQARTPRARATLDRDGFEALLAALHPDRVEAAERYAALRDRLGRFFEWNHADDPDALADEVMDRLARRAIDGGNEAEAVRHPEKFAAGIARLMLREQWRRQKADARLATSLQNQAAELPQQLEEQRQTEVAAGFLEECMSRLPASQRDLIQRYYSTEARNQIDARKELAGEFDISLNALRNRALRIRQDLEDCVRTKLERNLQ
jgi:DNA-directed RNA polymerase specialized sigma24 family protein